jgi:hypothetical protein
MLRSLQKLKELTHCGNVVPIRLSFRIFRLRNYMTDFKEILY